MPKVTLEFDLPEEREAFEIATRSPDIAATLADFDGFLRARIKYGDAYGLEPIRAKLWEIATERGVADLVV